MVAEQGFPIFCRFGKVKIVNYLMIVCVVVIITMFVMIWRWNSQWNHIEEFMDKYKRINPGMTVSELESVMGKPDSTSNYKSIDMRRLYYDIGVPGFSKFEIEISDNKVDWAIFPTKM